MKYIERLIKFDENNEFIKEELEFQYDSLIRLRNIIFKNTINKSESEILYTRFKIELKDATNLFKKLKQKQVIHSA